MTNEEALALAKECQERGEEFKVAAHERYKAYNPPWPYNIFLTALKIRINKELRSETNSNASLPCPYQSGAIYLDEGEFKRAMEILDIMFPL